MGDVSDIDKEVLRSAHTSASKLRGEVLNGPERRRRWSTEEKLRVLAQSMAPGSSPSLACRMHGISTGQLSTWGARMADVHRLVWGADGHVAERSGALPYDFRPGRPDWDSFPRQVWRRLTSRQGRDGSEELASYGDPAGYRPLREAVAVHLAYSRGVRCTAEQVVVVNGSQQGADLLKEPPLDFGGSTGLLRLPLRTGLLQQTQLQHEGDGGGQRGHCGVQPDQGRHTDQTRATERAAQVCVQRFPVAPLQFQR